jgi:hypothetical protein
VGASAQGWRKIAERLRSEFEKHGVDAAAILEEDRQNLTFRARLSTERPLWLKEVIGAPGVADGDPNQIAVLSTSALKSFASLLYLMQTGHRKHFQWTRSDGRGRV